MNAALEALPWFVWLVLSPLLWPHAVRVRCNWLRAVLVAVTFVPRYLEYVTGLAPHCIKAGVWPSGYLTRRFWLAGVPMFWTAWDGLLVEKPHGKH